MEEKHQVAEAVVSFAVEIEKKVRELDGLFERIVFSCAPSGYVGCSQECRGAGTRRRTGYMEDIVASLTEVGQKKDRLIISIAPLVAAFDELKNTRSGHVIYWRLGKGLSNQQYGEKFNISRRHAYRLYIKAMNELYYLILKNGGVDLIEKFK